MGTQKAAGSIVASGRFLGANKNLCKKAVIAAVSSYRKRMHDYAGMGYLELWYATVDEADI